MTPPSGTPRARLIVLSGPAGVGKGSVVAELRRQHPEVFVSISATTRRRRPNEIDGREYHFVSDAEFDRLIDQDALLEWAFVHGAFRYGTPRQPVIDALAAGRRALLEIDLQGARQVRTSCPDATFVFLAPPSWEELVRRLTGRGTESKEELDRRLDTAREEMAAAKEFNFNIVNREIPQAAAELVELFHL